MGVDGGVIDIESIDGGTKYQHDRIYSNSFVPRRLIRYCCSTLPASFEAIHV
jgi:hypothetical protein